MFKSLIYKLFNIRPKQSVARSDAFSSTDLSKKSHIKPAPPKPAAIAISDPLQLPAVDITALFYSLLFPTQRHDDSEMTNNLEQKIIQQVELALSDPESIAHNVLNMPTRALELDRQLANEQLEVEELLAIIQQEPVLSAEILKLCNSTAFKRSDKEVTHLQQAVVQLGRHQLRRLVTACVVKEMIDVKPIYFRRFGEQIWRHSMQVAFLADELSDNDNDTAFMMGLLHDVGKIAIFKLLLDAFQSAELTDQPQSTIFKQVMTAKSLALSALLVKCWNLPQHFELNFSLLSNQDSAPQDKRSIAYVLWRSNMISECSILQQAKLLSEPQLQKLLQQIELTEEDFGVIHQKLMKF